MQRSKETLIVAGGGTGGHVLAGVAVADAWKQLHGDRAEVLFVGAQGGIEEKLVPRAGYPLEVLRLGSLNRVSLERKIRTMLQLPFSLLRSLAILISKRPSAVLGVGGYASGPLVLMARVLSFFKLIGTRTAILEQNAVPGMTNRILGRVTNFIFCAFPGSEKEFDPKRARITGNPVRAEMKKLGAASPDPFTVFIFGGSLGALGINTLVIDSLPHLTDLLPRIRFIHQTGEKDFERVREAHAKAGSQARVEKFIYDMPQAYAEASLLICRAGSSTLAEVAAVGRAAVLVPFPFASDNHQEKNARIFVDAGAAQLLVQKDATGQDLARIIREALMNPSRVRAFEESVARFYRPNAAQDIAKALS